MKDHKHIRAIVKQNSMRLIAKTKRKHLRNMTPVSVVHPQ